MPSAGGQTRKTRPFQEISGTTARIAVIAVALSLNACGQTKPPQTDSYCGQYDRNRAKAKHDFGTILDADPAVRVQMPLEDCIQHNAVRLSIGLDDANTIAKAIVTICASEARAVEAESLKRDRTELPRVAQEGTEIYVQDAARAAVVQNRAAHCRPG